MTMSLGVKNRQQISNKHYDIPDKILFQLLSVGLKLKNWV